MRTLAVVFALTFAGPASADVLIPKDRPKPRPEPAPKPPDPPRPKPTPKVFPDGGANLVVGGATAAGVALAGVWVARRSRPTFAPGV